MAIPLYRGTETLPLCSAARGRRVRNPNGNRRGRRFSAAARQIKERMQKFRDFVKKKAEESSIRRYNEKHKALI
jgi:hypothetical protein